MLGLLNWTGRANGSDEMNDSSAQVSRIPVTGKRWSLVHIAKPQMASFALLFALSHAGNAQWEEHEKSDALAILGRARDATAGIADEYGGLSEEHRKGSILEEIGVVYAEVGEFEEALRTAERITSYLVAPSAYEAIARARIGLGDRAGAEVTLQNVPTRARTWGHRSPDTYVIQILAEGYEQAGEYEKAIQLLRKHGLGPSPRALALSGDIEGAIRTFVVSPGAVGVGGEARRIGEALAMRGETDGAIEFVSRVCGEKRSRVLPSISLKLLYVGKNEESERILQALEEDERARVAIDAIRRVRERLAKERSGIREFDVRRALHNLPDAPFYSGLTMLRLAEIEKMRGNTPEAARLLGRAFKLIGPLQPSGSFKHPFSAYNRKYVSMLRLATEQVGVGDLSGALRTAEQVGQDYGEWQRARLLRSVAREHARVTSSQRVMKWIDKEPSSLAKAYSLLGLAETMLCREIEEPALTDSELIMFVIWSANSLTDALTNPNVDVGLERTLIVDALRMAGLANNASSYLIHAIEKDIDPTVRRHAVVALKYVDSHSNETVQALLHALGDKDSHVRLEAAEALAHLGQRPQRTISVLVELLRNKDGFLRAQASRVLGDFGQSITTEASASLELVDTNDNYVRLHVAYALWKTTHQSESAVSKLILVLEDQDAWVRAQAARILGEIGPQAIEATPALLDAAKTSNPYVRLHVAEALWRVARNCRISVPILIGLLSDRKSPCLRIWAANFLASMGRAAKSARGPLRELLKDNQSKVREAAAQALRQMET